MANNSANDNSTVNLSDNTIFGQPPKWLRLTITGQILLAVVFVCLGVLHIAADGALSKLGTGIYVGFVVIVTSTLQMTLMNNRRRPGIARMVWAWRLCRVLSCASSLICIIDAPLVAVLSITTGSDAFGDKSARKTCVFGWNSFDCRVEGARVNAGALACDVALFLNGLACGYLLVMTGTYFWMCKKHVPSPINRQSIS